MNYIISEYIGLLKKQNSLLASKKENNAFDDFAIKTCKEDGMIVGHLPSGFSLTLKFILDSRARILSVFTSTHYRKLPSFKERWKFLAK